MIYPDLNEKNRDGLQPRALAIGWEIYSKKKISTNYGSWRDGPSGKGPATLSINSATTLNKSFTNTISGSYPIGEAQVASNLGVSIGKSKTYGTSYLIKIPSGVRQMIIFRPRYDTYEVKQRYYAKGTLTGKTSTCKVKIFSDSDYDFKSIK